MFIARFILIALIFMSFGIQMAKHGEPRKEHYDAGIGFVAVVIQITLLYFGGFFN